MELHCDAKTNINNTQDDKTLNGNAEKCRESEISQKMKSSKRHLICTIKRRTMWKSQF